MRVRIRPDLFVLWPAWIGLPIFGLAVLGFGVQSGDPALVAIGVLLLLLNIGIVLDHACFTTLSVEEGALVYRARFGTHEERVPVGSIQRIDAKRYPTSHGGALSAPNLVVRGRATTIKVNTTPYRAADLRALVETLQGLNRSIQLDDYWTDVVAGRAPESGRVARSRW